MTNSPATGAGKNIILIISVITAFILPYLQYYKPGFHPAQQDTQRLEKRWRTRLGFDG